jgi:hypothetical protein
MPKEEESSRFYFLQMCATVFKKIIKSKNLAAKGGKKE